MSWAVGFRIIWIVHAAYYCEPSGLFTLRVLFICIERKDPDRSTASQVLLLTIISLPLLDFLLVSSFLLLSLFYYVFLSDFGG